MSRNTESLRAEVDGLVEYLRLWAAEHRLNNGVMPVNEKLERYAAALDEYLRRTDNGARAACASIRAYENMLNGVPPRVPAE